MRIGNIFYSIMVHTAGMYTDRFFIRHQFKHAMHYYPDLDNPVTFQEKLQWLKLHDRKPEYTKMADKYLAKEFIKDRIGAQYVIPTIAVYDRAEDIDYESLPEEFVMKTTHDSGTVVICRDKSSLNVKKTNSYLSRRLKVKYYLKEREWPYKGVKPRIIVEKLLGNEGEDLMDYKFYCFNGDPRLMFVISNRWGGGGHRADYYNMEGENIAITQPGYNSSPVPPSLPSVFNEMKELAQQLSKGIPHIRVDFYYTGGQIYVGELTFFDSGGYLTFIPEEYNRILGDWIDLSIVHKTNRG